MTNRHLQRSPHGMRVHWVRCAGLAAGLALVIETWGCASHRPAPLLLEHASVPAVERNLKHGSGLKILTYNIWGLPSWMTGARSGRYPQIARELERLAPDIVLLQEAWTAQARNSAPRNGQWSIARAAGQHTFFQQSGLLTLSRFPILGGQFYPFSRSAYPDCFVNKGVLKVMVQLPDGEVLNVWNVHLQDGGPLEVRRSQVRELVSHIRAAEDGQAADLVGGDFNSTPDSLCCQELVHALGPGLQLLSAMKPFVTWDGLSAKPGAGETLDYLFLLPRRGCAALLSAPHPAFTASKLEQRLSDHLGIETVLDLEPASSSVATVVAPEDASTMLSAAASRSVSGDGE